jgi:hypothetical protein
VYHPVMCVNKVFEILNDLDEKRFAQELKLL